jgi:hypothetical protein
VAGLAIVQSWFKANGWGAIVTAIGVIVLIGQYQQRQVYLELSQADVVERVQLLEQARTNERLRLDSIYVLREVSINQNTEILRRLEELKSDIKEVRQAVR